VTTPPELIARPGGSPMADHVSGGAPPAAERLSVTGAVTSPSWPPGLFTAGGCAVALALKTASLATPLTSVEVTYEQAALVQLRSLQLTATTTRYSWTKPAVRVAVQSPPSSGCQQLPMYQFWAYGTPPSVTVLAVVGSAALAPASSAAVLSHVFCMSTRYAATPVTGLAHCSSVVFLSRPDTIAEPLILRTRSTASSASWTAVCTPRCWLVTETARTKKPVSAVITTPITPIDTRISTRENPASAARCFMAATVTSRPTETERPTRTRTPMPMPTPMSMETVPASATVPAWP
jgi:hypothetical protein